MSLLNTVTNGIQSATYNPEAEKAKKEAAEANAAAVQDYRKLLLSTRDNITAKRTTLALYTYTIDSAKVDEGFAWLQAHPAATTEELNTRKTNLATDLTTLDQQNDRLKALENASAYFSVLTDLRDTTADQKKSVATLKTAIQAFLAKTPTATTPTPEQIQKQIADFQNQFTTIFPGKDLYVESSAEAMSSLKDQHSQQKKVDNATFNISRLFGHIWDTASSTVSGLLIVTLVLVSGMLTANDAIGREWPYRIFYFIYGGIFFPVMLIYYLYRWFFGSSPKLYALLPVRTVQATTTLARMLLFPITYTPDERSKKAYTDFMKEAAELVGKKYTGAGLSNSANTVASSSFADIANAIRDLNLPQGAAALDQTAKITELMQQLNLPTQGQGLPTQGQGQAILESLKRLSLQPRT
jgi:hypothetical protein